MTNYQATTPAVKHEPSPSPTHRTPTPGARAFCSIMRVYACATGPRAGWTKFSDADKHAIINRHLVEDGKRAISRATFYRWKGEARDAGLLDFTSTAKRRRDRKRQAGGLWMRVVTVPTSSQCQGRRPRRAALHETPCAPPLHETPCAPYKEEDLRDPSSQRDQGKERAPSSNHGAECKAEPNVEPPALVPSDSQAPQTQDQGQKRQDGESLKEIEARLDEVATELGAAPTNPKPGRRFEIRDARARGHTADELEKLVAVAVEDRWAKKKKYWGDVVAHAMKCSKRYRARTSKEGGHPRSFAEGGSDVEREAMIGARPEDGTEDEDQELVESDDGDVQPTTEQPTDPPVEETVEEVEPRISWGEYLRRHPEASKRTPWGGRRKA